MLRCHNRPDPSVPKECGGKTRRRPIRGNRTPRRLGQRTSIPVAGLLEVKRRSLGLDRLPEKIKSVKGLMSYEQTPEPLEKGILRARNELSVFRDGTARYDMIDVPVTHFRPSEIHTSWEKCTEKRTARKARQADGQKRNKITVMHTHTHRTNPCNRKNESPHACLLRNSLLIHQMY